MAYPDKINALVDVTADQTLAAGGHAARHNDVNDALEEVRDALGGGSPVQAQSASTTPLVLRGAAGQTANLLELQNGAGGVEFSIDQTGSTTVDGNIFAAGILRMTGDGSESSPSIQPGADGDTGLFLPASNTIGFTTAGSERMRVINTGSVLIGTTSEGSAGAGDLVVDGGVFLGGNAAANELDDYEEGTWTPEYTFSTSGSVTHDIQSGDYVRINDNVFIHVRIRTDAVSSPTGSVRISGLPFNTNATTSLNYGMGGVVVTCNNFGGDHPSVVAVPTGGVDYVDLRFRNTADGNLIVLQGSDMGTGANNNDLQFNAWYRAVA